MTGFDDVDNLIDDLMVCKECEQIFSSNQKHTLDDCIKHKKIIKKREKEVNAIWGK